MRFPPSEVWEEFTKTWPHKSRHLFQHSNLRLEGYKQPYLCARLALIFTNYNSLKIGKPETKNIGKTPDNPKRALRKNKLKGPLGLSAI